MVSIEEEPWFLNICEELDAFCQKVEEKINNEQHEVKACEIRNELDTKLVQERKLNAELTEQLAELNRRGEELERACSNIYKLIITENDQQRLDNAKEAYEVGKELTGIRFDFSAPPNKLKGYIKNASQKVLLPFDTDVNPDTMWDLIKTARDQRCRDKENHNSN